MKLLLRVAGDVVCAADVGVGSGSAHGLVPFVPEAARCFLPVGETGVCKRKGGSQGPETQRNCRLRKFGLSFWVEAPGSALRGWPLSNRTNNAARPSSRASEDLVSCLPKGSLRAGRRFVARRRDT